MLANDPIDTLTESNLATEAIAAEAELADQHCQPPQKPAAAEDFEDDLESSAENIAALADVLVMASWHGVVERRTLSAVANLMFEEGVKLRRAKDAAVRSLVRT